MRANEELRRVVGCRDFWVGVSFLLLGAVLLLEVTGFRGSAARLPWIASVMLTALGGVLALRAALFDSAGTLQVAALRAIAVGPLANAGLLFVWVFLVNRGYGFFELGVPLVMASVYLMGHRRLATNAVYSVAIVGVVFLLFYAVFRVRLPVSALLGYAFG